ncbi:MAG: HEAT repeat domain-containing protein [Asgard group archaeon]|nr:HEAT repeat domain-containing protein [Asgard group archaeon]
MTTKDDIRLLVLNKKENELLESLSKDTERVQGFLMEITRKDSNWKIRRDAIKILGKGKVTQSIELLREILLKDHLTVLRKTAAKALGNIGDLVVIQPLIEALNTSKDPSIIIEVAGSLGVLKATEAIDDLLKMLKNKDGEIRENVAQALGMIGDSKAIDPLLKILRDDQEAWDRGQAAEALGLIGDKRVVSDLIHVLENDDGIGVSVKTATALGRLKDPIAVDPLISFLQKSQNVAERRAIAYALGEIGDKRAAEVFIELLEDDDETVRYWACLSLGFMQYKKAANTLLDVLKADESIRVRKTAAVSIGQLVPKTKKCVQVLLDTLKTESDQEVQEKINSTLERIAKNQGYKNKKEMIKEMGFEK